jgi:hypothetical protein
MYQYAAHGRPADLRQFDALWIAHRLVGDATVVRATKRVKRLGCAGLRDSESIHLDV